jgi:hypothetical protein
MAHPAGQMAGCFFWRKKMLDISHYDLIIFGRELKNHFGSPCHLDDQDPLPGKSQPVP